MHTETLPDIGGRAVQGQRTKFLLVLGFGLFLIGLLNGLVVQYVTNPRMGLAAHMAGVQNGMFLAIVGLAWKHVTLPDKLDALAAWLMAGGMFAIWLSLFLAALLGTSGMTPIAGHGFAGTDAAEMLVNIILVSGSGASIAATVLLLQGLIARR